MGFPADTLITVNTLATYNAAYSGGSVITQDYVAGTEYIRTTLSDPFGPTDINDSGTGTYYSKLTITPPGSCGGSATTVALTSTYLKNTSGATKTYEYP